MIPFRDPRRNSVTLDLTDFYSPVNPQHCGIQTTASAVTIGAAGARFIIRDGKIEVHWHTPWTGDERRLRPVGDVAAVHARPDQRTADGRKSMRLELTWRDGRTIVPMVRRERAAVRWAEWHLRDVLGFAPTTTPVTLEENVGKLQPIVPDAATRAREDGADSAVVRLGPDRPYVLLRVDREGLRASLHGSPIDRSFAWPGADIFEISAYGGSTSDYAPAAEKLDLRLMDGGRVRLAELKPPEGAAVADLLTRVLRLPSRGERARRFLSVDDDVRRPAPVPTTSTNVPSRRPPPLLPYGREGALPVLVTRRDSMLTVARPPAPVKAALPRRLLLSSPLLVIALGLVTFAGTRPNAPIGVLIAGGAVAVGLWLGAAAATLGEQVDVTVNETHLTHRVTPPRRAAVVRRWNVDQIRDVCRSSRGLVLETKDSSPSHVLLAGLPAGELDEIAATVRAALGFDPPPRPPSTSARVDNPPLASAPPA